MGLGVYGLMGFKGLGAYGCLGVQGAEWLWSGFGSRGFKGLGFEEGSRTEGFWVQGCWLRAFRFPPVGSDFGP